MAQTLSESAVSEIKQMIDSATADPNKIPGCVFVVIGKDGKPLLQHASGRRGVATQEPMTMESVFWIASCTKMIGGIACMQLVEQGKLSLDDADQVEKILPEFKNMKVLKEMTPDGKPVLVEKEKGITLRMLLSHTAGFGYTFFSSKLREYTNPIGSDELSGLPKDVQELPLVNQPGSRWEYGTNIDWAGNIVERVTGMSLNDYFQEHIFKPLGVKNISMFPDEYMKSKLAHMHFKQTTGSIYNRPHLLRAPLLAGKEDIPKIYNSAGAGCFAQPVEYTKIIAMLLNDGQSPHTGNRLLKKETVDEMFKNQIPEFPDFGRQGIEAAKPDYTNPLGDLYPQPREQGQGWGLTFMITEHPGPTGRGANTGHWAGLPNLFWWADREKGVGGMIASQIVPFGNMDVLGLWFGVEGHVYANLK